MALSLEDRLVVASRALGRSVVSINPYAREEAKCRREGFSCLGVKDDAGLPREILERFRSSPDWLVLTIDHKADLGRSVDTELLNPLTYKPMTGSTSGGPINVLKGINDVCMGTDGGGSVLAPALATNLFAIMGKGLGLLTKGEGRSTDGLAFRGGVGFIGRSLKLVVSAAEFGCGMTLDGGELPRIVAPVVGSVRLPDGADMREKVDGLLAAAILPPASDYAFSDVYDRACTVPELAALWDREPLTCVVTFEGPIDVLSADETIPRGFGGAAPGAIAGVRSKAVCKSVNMAGGTAVCVPVGELACGILISCGPGVEAARGAVRLASELTSCIELPGMLVRFFQDRMKPPMPLELFK